MRKSLIFLVVIAMVIGSAWAVFHFFQFSSLMNDSDNDERETIFPPGMTIIDRFGLPEKNDSTVRCLLDTNSFGTFLRNFPLKEHGAEVYYFDGTQKQKNVHEAVLDIDVGSKDLQQCADAVIRLYAEYLFAAGRYEDIGFHFTNGFYCDYIHWRDGNRIQVNGNNVSWVHSSSKNETHDVFLAYLETIFMYAGTLSLSKELIPIAYSDLMPGDVIIRGGSPGHAVLVVDCAVDKNGQKYFILAQSYMPAQSIHILKNLNEPDISPWYRLNPEDRIVETPEWNFSSSECKRFPETIER